MRPVIVALAALVMAAPAYADLSFEFPNIDGGTHQMSDWAGQPVLVVNTASQCGFTPQYEGLQALHDTYGAQGLVVLAVPSDDFRQELDDAEAVKEFCEITYGLTLPMTDILHVRGDQAHPFYQWLAEQDGFVPRWNFNKVLIGADGDIVATWGSMTKPEAPKITRQIEAELAR